MKFLLIGYSVFITGSSAFWDSYILVFCFFCQAPELIKHAASILFLSQCPSQSLFIVFCSDSAHTQTHSHISMPVLSTYNMSVKMDTDCLGGVFVVCVGGCRYKCTYTRWNGLNSIPQSQQFCVYTCANRAAVWKRVNSPAASVWPHYPDYSGGSPAVVREMTDRPALAGTPLMISLCIPLPVCPQS